MSDKPDTRKYDVDDEVDFTDDEGKVVPGIVHAVRYQVGRYELVGEHHEDMFDKTSRVIPGTGQMQLVPGTEKERHSFEYIMVHKDEHDAWWAHENTNNAKIKEHVKKAKAHRELHKNITDEEYLKLEDHPISPVIDLNHPPLRQHIRVFEED